LPFAGYRFLNNFLDGAGDRTAAPAGAGPGAAKIEKSVAGN